MGQSYQFLPIHGWRIMKALLPITPRCAQETTSISSSNGRYTESESWLTSVPIASFLIFPELGYPSVCYTRTQKNNCFGTKAMSARINVASVFLNPIRTSLDWVLTWMMFFHQT